MEINQFVFTCLRHLLVTPMSHYTPTARTDRFNERETKDKVTVKLKASQSAFKKRLRKTSGPTMSFKPLSGDGTPCQKVTVKSKGSTSTLWSRFTIDSIQYLKHQGSVSEWKLLFHSALEMHHVITKKNQPWILRGLIPSPRIIWSSTQSSLINYVTLRFFYLFIFKTVQLPKMEKCSISMMKHHWALLLATVFLQFRAGEKT